MSVLIKGMKMPENCFACPFIIEEDIDFDIYLRCGAGKNGYIHEEDTDGFPADCPLVDLGEHGDLIDRDVLEQGMLNGIKAGNLEEGYEMFTNINTMDDCVEYVRWADAVIEAEEEA